MSFDRVLVDFTFAFADKSYSSECILFVRFPTAKNMANFENEFRDCILKILVTINVYSALDGYWLVVLSDLLLSYIGQPNS